MKKWNDDGTFRYHRTVIEPGIDPDAQMALVNANIRQIGKHAECPTQDIARLRSEVQKHHTQDVVAKFRNEQS